MVNHNDTHKKTEYTLILKQHGSASHGRYSGIIHLNFILLDVGFVFVTSQLIIYFLITSIYYCTIFTKLQNTTVAEY